MRFGRSDIDVKLKPVAHTPYRILCVTHLLEHLVSVLYAEDLRSNPLQFHQSIISFMMRRIPRTMEMDEKTLIIFTEDITYMLNCLSMNCTFCI